MSRIFRSRILHPKIPKNAKQYLKNNPLNSKICTVLCSIRKNLHLTELVYTVVRPWCSSVYTNGYFPLQMCKALCDAWTLRRGQQIITIIKFYFLLKHLRLQNIYKGQSYLQHWAEGNLQGTAAQQWCRLGREANRGTRPILLDSTGSILGGGQIYLITVMYARRGWILHVLCVQIQNSNNNDKDNHIK